MATTKKEIHTEITRVRATLRELASALDNADKSAVDLTTVLESVTMADGELLVALRDLQAHPRPKRRKATTKRKTTKAKATTKTRKTTKKKRGR